MENACLLGFLSWTEGLALSGSFLLPSFASLLLIALRLFAGFLKTSNGSFVISD